MSATVDDSEEADPIDELQQMRPTLEKVADGNYPASGLCETLLTALDEEVEG